MGVKPVFAGNKPVTSKWANRLGFTTTMPFVVGFSFSLGAKLHLDGLTSARRLCSFFLFLWCKRLPPPPFSLPSETAILASCHAVKYVAASLPRPFTAIGKGGQVYAVCQRLCLGVAYQIAYQHKLYSLFFLHIISAVLAHKFIP